MNLDRWITQTIFFGDEQGRNGNCTEACVASLYGLPLESIPDFHSEGEGGYWPKLRRYFSSNGIYLLHLPPNHTPPVMYFGVGPASRGCNHMVIMMEGEVIWDPHPSREGLLSVQAIYVPVAFDPTRVGLGAGTI